MKENAINVSSGGSGGPVRRAARKKKTTRQPRRTREEVAAREREGTAHHEAGHVVYMCHAGLPFDSVDIIANEDILGYVDNPGICISHYDGSPEEMLIEIDRRVVSDLAGLAAETRFKRRLRWKYGSGDFESAIELAQIRLGPATLTEIEAYLRFQWVRANEFFTDNNRWKAVEAVAQALLQRERLTHEEVAALTRRFLELPIAPDPLSTFAKWLIRRGLRWDIWRRRLTIDERRSSRPRALAIADNADPARIDQAPDENP
jgi:ATP-dependent Zn protease